MTIQRRFMYLSRLAVAATAFAVFSPMAAHAQYSSPIHDVDNGARQPVQLSLSLGGTDGSAELSGNPSQFPGNFYVVPAGKRLVIEQVTTRAVVPPTQVIFATLFVVSGGNTVAHYLHLDPPVVQNVINTYVTTLQVRLYADSGTQLLFRLDRPDPTGNWAGFVTVSGYLVNLP